MMGEGSSREFDFWRCGAGNNARELLAVGVVEAEV